MKQLFSMFITVFLVTALHSQWQQTSSVPQGAGVTDMVALNDGTVIVTTASYNWPSGQPGGIRRSTNGGITWQNVMNIYNARTLWLGTSGKIFASCWNYPQNEGMFFSTNGGENWTQTFFGAANDNVFSIAAKNGDSMVYVGTRNGVFRSFNNGAWIQLTAGFPANTFVYDLDIDTQTGIIAAGTSKGAYTSSNHGNLWTAISGVSQNDTIRSVKFHYSQTDDPQDKLILGSSEGEVYSVERESGAFQLAVLFHVFTGAVSDVESYEGIDFLPACIFPFGLDAVSNTGFFYSTNGGSNWIENNTGLPSAPKLSSLACHSSGGSYTMYAGFFENTTGGAKIFRYSSVIGIQPVSNEVPGSYSLSQNYPNPFNPSTNIEFKVPTSTFVKLAVYDILGREVKLLVNDNLNAGVYRVQWNAADYPGGVYFCKLTSGSFSEILKMILTK